jgi:PAS domain S-box-containing protein
MVEENTGKNSITNPEPFSERYALLQEEYLNLAARESLLRATLENISDTVVITDDNGKFTFVCPNTNLIFGLSTEEVFLLGSVDKLIHGPVCDIDRLRAEKEINNIERSFVDSSGTRRFLLINAKVVNIGGGTVLYVMRDISNMKQAEEQKQTAELRFQHFIANFPGVAYQFRLNLQGDYSYDYISDKCELLLGVPTAEIVKDASLIFRLIPETDLADVRRAIMASANAMTPYQIEHRVVRPDGKTLWIKASSIPRNMANGDIVWDGIGLDITDRKQAEESIRMSEETLRKAQRIGRMSSWRHTLGKTPIDRGGKDFLFLVQDGQPTWVSKTGLSSSIHPEDRPLFETALAKAMSKGIGFNLELRTAQSNGKIGYIHSVCDVLRDKSGRAMELIGTIQDITKIKIIQQELEAAETRYRTVVEDQTELISRFSADGKFLFVNQAYCRFFDKKPYDLPENRWQPVAFVEDRGRIEQQLLQLSPTNPVVVIENRVCKGDGDIRWVQFINRGIFNSANTLVEIQSVGRDISDLKDIQMSLQQKEDELSNKNSQLERLNIALEVVIEQKNEQLGTLQSDIIKQYNSLVKPHIDELKNISQNRRDAQYLTLIEHGIQQILSPFAQQISSLSNHLSPMETKVASLITNGMSIKGMAQELKISPHTVKYHRKNIRSKLGIQNQKINLRSYLLGNVSQKKG